MATSGRGRDELEDTPEGRGYYGGEQAVDLARRYEAILDAAGEGIYGLDPEGRVTFVNPAAARTLGREAGELVGHRMHEAVHHSRPDGSPYPAEECPVYETLRDGVVHRSDEEVFWRADGMSFPVRYTATPIVEDGVLTGAVVTFSDVTERDRAEQALRESETRLSAIFSQAAVGISELSADGRFLRVNDELCRILGRSRQELLRTSMPEVTHPGDVAESFSAFERVLHTGELASVDKRYRRPDGEVVHANSRLTLLDEARGGPPTMLAVTVDLTERKRQEANAAFLNEVSQDLVQLTDIDETMNTIGEKIGAHFGLSACLFAELVDAAQIGVINHGWHRADMPSLLGTYRMEEFVEPEVLEHCRAGEAVVIRDVFVDPRTDGEQYAALNIGSFVSIPLVRDGEWRFLLVVYRSERYDWRDDDIELVRELARRIWTRLERARAEEQVREQEERLELATGAAELGIWELDLTTNDSPVHSERHDEIFGYGEPLEEWNVESFLDHVHPDDRGRIRRSFEEALRTGAWEFECRIAADGEERWITAHGKFYYEEGERGSEPVRAVGTVQDITVRKWAEAEREQARRRTGFLAEASRRLSDSLDYEQTLSEVARLAVPRICDLCVVDTLGAPGEGGSVRRLAAAHRDPEKERLAWELERLYPVGEDPRSGIAEAIRTGEPVLVSEINEQWLEYVAQDEAHLQLLKGLELGSMVIVPLVTHGRVLGALTLASDGSGRRYDEEDLTLAQDLARRAAQAMDNARLYEEQSHAAQTLQQSILPPSMPEVPGMEAAVRFRPAASAGGRATGGYDVGGDFYDLFQTPAGWAVVVGDVVGKGVEAAQLATMARYTLRTAAMQGVQPSEVVSTLNAAILDQNSGERFCTLAYGLMNPSDKSSEEGSSVDDGSVDDGSVDDGSVDGEPGKGGARLRLCRGGHPPPLILRTYGTVEEAGVRGKLVGVYSDSNFEDLDVSLAPGEAVIFYTDGVTEARDPEGELFGDERLKSVVGSCPALDAEGIAEAVEKGVAEFQNGTAARDDVAILVVKATA